MDDSEKVEAFAGHKLDELTRADMDSILADVHKISFHLKVLLGDTYFWTESINKQEIAARVKAILAEPERMRTVQKAQENKNQKETWMDTVQTYLAMIFEQRYGWPEEKTKSMNIHELAIALEHAVEHDEQGKPSIWDVTK